MSGGKIRSGQPNNATLRRRRHLIKCNSLSLVAQLLSSCLLRSQQKLYKDWVKPWPVCETDVDENCSATFHQKCRKSKVPDAWCDILAFSPASAAFSLLCLFLSDSLCINRIYTQYLHSQIYNKLFAFASSCVRTEQLLHCWNPKSTTATVWCEFVTHSLTLSFRNPHIYSCAAYAA